MKLTKNQKKELTVLLWFRPLNSPKGEVTQDDIKKFFDYSDKGIGRQDAELCLAQPAGFSPGFVGLMAGKKYRDLQVKDWKEGWGNPDAGCVTSWDFIHEPREIAEWVTEVLDREAIILHWHEERIREHRREAYKYRRIIATKSSNRPMEVSRS